MAARKFLLIAFMRTGSTLLTKFVAMHPHIQSDGEIFADGWQIEPGSREPVEMLEMRAQQCSRDVYGVLFRLGQVHDCTQRFSHKFLNDLHALGWDFIYLRRLNLLRQALSMLIAYQRGIWHENAKSTSRPFQICVNPRVVLSTVKHFELVQGVYDATMRRIPHLSLTYEQDLLLGERHQETMDRVFAYLGVASVPVEARYRRTSGDPLSTYLVNHVEVLEAVRESSYARFIEESMIDRGTELARPTQEQAVDMR